MHRATTVWSPADRRRTPGHRRGTSPAAWVVSGCHGCRAARPAGATAGCSPARRLDEPAHDPETAWAGAERLISIRAVTLITGGGHPAQGPGTHLRLVRALGGRSRRYSGYFDGSGESATCRVEEPVLGEWCLGWSIEHPGMDCLNQGPRGLP